MAEIKPISLRDANKFLIQHHRHHKAVVGCKFAISIRQNDIIKGVAICSRPVSRHIDDGNTLEISRVCVQDFVNVCSMLYGACARIAKYMGYSKIQTYILVSEPGISLKASGWLMEADNVGGKQWNSSGKMKRTNTNVDLFGTEEKYPSELKQRWVKHLNHGVK